MVKYVLAFCFFICCAIHSKAQKPDSVILKSKADSLNLNKAADTNSYRSLKPKIKKEKVYHPDSTHSPHTAIMRSLLIPGWGQVYNHRWWKVPLIYGGLGGLAAIVIFNQQNYAIFAKLSYYRNRGITPGLNDPYYSQYVLYRSVTNNQAIYDASDAYRRNRDLGILGLVGFWGINVVDAYIDAKFIHSFTVDSNLSLKVAPGLINQPVYAQNFNPSYIPGIKIIFTLR